MISLAYDQESMRINGVMAMLSVMVGLPLPLPVFQYLAYRWASQMQVWRGSDPCVVLHLFLPGMTVHTTLAFAMFPLVYVVKPVIK